MEERFERYHPDIEAMHRGFRTKPCFVCEMVNGNIRFPENVIREDEQTLVSSTHTRGPTATPWWSPKSTASR